MSEKKLEWLKNYLVEHGFTCIDQELLQHQISGMTAKEIIKAMEEAKIITDQLKNSSLGRELF